MLNLFLLLCVGIFGFNHAQYAPVFPERLPEVPQSEKSDFARNPLFKVLQINSNLANIPKYQAPQLQSGFPCDFNLFNASAPMKYYLDNSGKSPNDYGLYDACQNLNSIPEIGNHYPAVYLKYYLNFAKVLPLQWGLCIPADCFDMVNTTFTLSLAAINVTVSSVIYDDLSPVEVNSPEAIVMICIASLLLVLGIIGMIFENTNLGNKQRHQPEYYPPLLNHESVPQGIPPSQTSQIASSEGQSETLAPPMNNLLMNVEAPSQAPQLVPPPPAPPVEQDAIEKKATPFKVLTCFSLSYNLKKIVYRSRPKSETDVLDGVRVLSIMWVIFGHSYVFSLGVARNQSQIITDYTKQFLFTTVTSGLFAVDTFFFLSAFLAGYIFLRKYPAQQRFMNPLKVLLIYFQRYYRLTPLLAFCMYFSVFVIYPMASGPSRQQLYDFNIEECRDHGWSNILYINNYYPKDAQCFGWVWYLANDFQMFLLLPWILMLYKFFSLLGILVLVGLLVANIVCTFIINWHYNFNVSPLWNPNSEEFMRIFYIKPWIRITPYLVGLALAMMYENYKDGVKYDNQIEEWKKLHPGNQNMDEIDDLRRIRKVHKGFGYYFFIITKKSTFYAWLYLVGGFAITFIMVYVPYDVNKDQGNAWQKFGKGLYNSFARGMFAVGLSLVLIPLFTGRFPVLSAFLGNGLFGSMSKITYSVYLMHEALLNVFNMSSREAIYISHIEAIIMTLSVAVLSYLIGGAMSLLAESPFANLDKHVFFPDKKKKSINAGYKQMN